MRIALIQEKQNELYQFGNRDIRYTISEAKALQTQMVRQNLHMLWEAAGKECDLIVTSEMINYAGQPFKIAGEYADLIPDMSDELFTELGNIAKAGNCYLAVGVCRKEENLSEAQMFNSILLYNRGGELCAIYDKVHLAGDENDYFTCGDSYCVVDTDFGRLGLAICWDMQFAETCQTMADRNADLIVVPTWGWEWIYGPCRAYENGVYVASAMAVPFDMPIEGLRSPSEMIGPEGVRLAVGSREEAQIVICDIPDVRACAEYREMRRSCRRQKIRLLEKGSGII